MECCQEMTAMEDYELSCVVNAVATARLIENWIYG
jgi:hypothetical protein